MKKTALVLLTLFCCLCILTACHECTWATVWSNDATHHWHECSDNNCKEIVDKAEHALVTKYSDDNTKSWTQCECGYKTAEIDNVTQAVWEEQLDTTKWTNYTLRVLQQDEENYNSESIMFAIDSANKLFFQNMFENDINISAYWNVVADGTDLYNVNEQGVVTYKKSTTTEEQLLTHFAQMTESFFTYVAYFKDNFENFTYDKSTGVYNHLPEKTDDFFAYFDDNADIANLNLELLTVKFEQDVLVEVCMVSSSDENMQTIVWQPSANITLPKVTE